MSIFYLSLFGDFLRVKLWVFTAISVIGEQKISEAVLSVVQGQVQLRLRRR